MADLVGSTLGRFEVTGVLGAGGFATVYRAHDPVLGDDVAIKVLGDNHARNNDVRMRFEQEGKLLRRFASAGPLLQVYDAAETPDGQPYLVLEMASGGTLAHRLAERSPVTAADLVRLIERLRDATEPLHRASVVHRDLSPGNIFIDGPPRDPGTALFDVSDRILLGDLGLAKDLGRSSGLTAGGGTSEFASPEQLLPFGEVTTAADIYGAGALIRYVAAETPFAEVLKPVLDTATADDPAVRQKSMGQLAADIRRVLEDSPAPSKAAFSRRSIALLGSAAIGALCVVLVALRVGGGDGADTASTTATVDASTFTAGSSDDTEAAGEDAAMVGPDSDEAPPTTVTPTTVDASTASGEPALQDDADALPTTSARATTAAPSSSAVPTTAAPTTTSTTRAPSTTTASPTTLGDPATTTTSTATAVVAVSGGMLRAGWDDFSWGRLDDRADLLGVEVEGFGAVAVRSSAPQPIDGSSWLRIRLAGDSSDAVLDLRVDPGIDGGAQCRLQAAAFAAPGWIEVPLLDLTGSPTLQRVNLIEAVGSPWGPIDIDEVAVFTGPAASGASYCR